MNPLAALVEVLNNADDKKLVFLFLVMVVALPTYMAYRIEIAVDRLADRLECGEKITISQVRK